MVDETPGGAGPHPPGEDPRAEEDRPFRALDEKIEKLKGALDEERPVEQRLYRGMLLVTYLGVFFVIAVLAPTTAGWWLDARLGTTPWLTLLGMGLGLAAGVSGCYKTLRSYWERVS